jgi:hypothetical protein
MLLFAFLSVCPILFHHLDLIVKLIGCCFVFLHSSLLLISIISITGGTDEDIKARKRKAQQAFAMLKPVWRSTTLRTSTKLRLFFLGDSILRPVL